MRMTRKKRIPGPHEQFPVGMNKNEARLHTSYYKHYDQKRSNVVKERLDDNIKHPNWFIGGTDYHRSYSPIRYRSQQVVDEHKIRKKVEKVIKKNMAKDNVLQTKKIRTAQAHAKMERVPRGAKHDEAPQLPLHSRTQYRDQFIPKKRMYKHPRRLTPDNLRSHNPNIGLGTTGHTQDTHKEKVIDQQKRDMVYKGIKNFDLKTQELWFDKSRPLGTEYKQKYDLRQK